MGGACGTGIGWRPHGWEAHAEAHAGQASGGAQVNAQVKRAGGAGGTGIGRRTRRDKLEPVTLIETMTRHARLPELTSDDLGESAT